MNYTPKQLEILRIIKRTIEEKGYSPTYAEIAGVMKTSPVTVFEHIGALEKKGAIRRRKYEARSMEIIDHAFDMVKVVKDQTEIDKEIKPFVDLLVKIKGQLMAENEFADVVVVDVETTGRIDSLLAKYKHLIGDTNG